MKPRWPSVELNALTENDRSITYGVVKPGEKMEGGVVFVRGGELYQGRIALEALRTITPHVSQVYQRTILHGGE